MSHRPGGLAPEEIVCLASGRRAGAAFRADPAGAGRGSREAIPVSVSLPLREDRYIGDPVLAVFENLLPDDDDIRLAERSRAHGFDAYSLCAAIGRDCVGALQFLPDGIGQAGLIDARAVNDEDIARIVSDLARSPLGIGEDREFRISLYPNHSSWMWLSVP
jgi:serine/threonine-protein kinase HipA